MSNIPPDVKGTVELLTQINPCPEEIWLIGSRANGRATETSDWDLLVFASSAFKDKANNQFPPIRIDADILVVTDGDSFQALGKVKSGTLSGWSWKKTAQDAASYVGTTFIADAESSREFGGDMGNMVTREEKAIRLWAAN